MNDVAEKYGDERRTIIDTSLSADLNEDDLVRDEATLISITERGYVKRVGFETFRAQGRGGRGVKGHKTKEEDEVMILMPARTLHTILFFSDRGKVYSEKVHRIPEAGRTSPGLPIVNILALDPRETITAAVIVPDFEQADYCVLMTRQGRIKRVDLSEFAAVRPSGLIAMALKEDDELGWVRLTHGDNEVVIISEQGRALRFPESEVRPMGRPAGGVTGINLKPGDKVTGLEVLEPGADLLVVTTGGYGKRTPLDQYPPKGRATMGVQTVDPKAIPRIGMVAAARVVQKDDDLTIISTNGIVIRTEVEQIKVAGRSTMGVRLMNLGDDDSVASVARISAAELASASADEEERAAQEAALKAETIPQNGTSQNSSETSPEELEESE
jgi:DNA gyrase subunit A